jgi:glycogen debranching enzyme
MVVSAQPTWTPGLAQIQVRARDCRVTALHVDHARMDRAGLLSSYGIKSAHPLDGKHPAPGAPTDFWSGTIWGPHQLHGVQALQRYGYSVLAEAVARAYCDCVAGAYASGGDAFEHHSHEDGRGLGTLGYTWGAGTALVLMQDVLDEAEA